MRGMGGLLDQSNIHFSGEKLFFQGFGVSHLYGNSSFPVILAVGGQEGMNQAVSQSGADSQPEPGLIGAVVHTAVQLVNCLSTW